MLRSTGKLRELPNEAAANVKDRLRDLRDFIRARRHDRLEAHGLRGPAGQLEEFLGHAASVVDDTLTLAESVSTTLLPLRESENTPPRALTVYFPGETMSWSGERAFRRDMYALAKRAGSAFRLEGQPIRESAFSAAHSSMRRSHTPLLEGLFQPSQERLRVVAKAAAALLLELQQAVGTEIPARSFVRGYVPGLLGSALVTLDPEIAGEPEFFQLVLLATEAREDRITSSLAERSSAALADVFAGLLMHLA